MKRMLRSAGAFLLIFSFSVCASTVQGAALNTSCKTVSTPSATAQALSATSSYVTEAQTQPVPQERADKLFSQFSEVENSAGGDTSSFALKNGYLLEQGNACVNLNKAGTFIQDTISGKTAELVVFKYGYSGSPYVYLLQSKNGTCTVTIAGDCPTQSFDTKLLKETEHEYQIGEDGRSPYLPLYIGKRGSNGYPAIFNDRNDQPFMVDEKLIDAIGQVNYFEWLERAATDTRATRSNRLSIEHLLRDLGVDYDTFARAVGADTPFYSLDDIKKDNYREYVKIKTESSAPEAIGKLCFEAWMNKHMTDLAEDGTKVLSYKLHEITSFAGDQNEFAVRIQYDFTTTINEYGMTALFSANADADGKGGFTDATLEMRIQKVGLNSYAVKSVGTGGIAAGLASLPKQEEDKALAAKSLSSVKSNEEKAKIILAQMKQKNAAAYALENGYVLELADSCVNYSMVVAFEEALTDAKDYELIIGKRGPVNDGINGYSVYFFKVDEAGEYTASRYGDWSGEETIAGKSLAVDESISGKEYLLGTDIQGDRWPVYVGKDGSSHYTKLCTHTAWENTIDSSLIHLVGDYNYLQWLKTAAHKSRTQTGCTVNIYYFLQDFHIDYDTLVGTVGAGTKLYDLSLIKKSVYPEYLKITTTATAPEKIGAMILNEWMKKKMETPLEDGTKVTSFHIQETKVFAGDLDEFAIWFEYDFTATRDKNGSTLHMAGSTMSDSKGLHAYTEMRIKKVSKTGYVLLSVGTGGAGQGLKAVNP